MINILEYALLSGHVYKPEQSKYHGLTISHRLPKQSTENNWALIKETEHFSPCFAALYVKFHNHKATDAVIAIRGTQSFTDAKVDFDAWQSEVLSSGRYDRIPTYYPQVFSFYRLALAYVQQHFGLSKVSFTGHSLGGALAQLLVGLGKQPFIAVTFNSPGTAHIPGVSTEMGPWVHGVNSRYGFINKIGERLGSVLYVDVPQEEGLAKEAVALHEQLQNISSGTEDHLNFFERAGMNEYRRQEIQAMDDAFIASVYPQHSILNMIAALKHHPEVGQRVLG
jgi:pimeloyl-ACP methyl ester carboxylesterase